MTWVLLFVGAADGMVLSESGWAGSALNVGLGMCVDVGCGSVLGGCETGSLCGMGWGGAERLGIGGAYLVGGLLFVSILCGWVLGGRVGREMGAWTDESLDVLAEESLASIHLVHGHSVN